MAAEARTTRPRDGLAGRAMTGIYVASAYRGERTVRSKPFSDNDLELCLYVAVLDAFGGRIFGHSPAARNDLASKVKPLIVTARRGNPGVGNGHGSRGRDKCLFRPTPGLKSKGRSQASRVLAGSSGSPDAIVGTSWECDLCCVRHRQASGQALPPIDPQPGLDCPKMLVCSETR